LVPSRRGVGARDDDPAVRIVSYVVDVEPEALAAEMRLAVTFRPLAFPTVPGREVIVPMFTPS
jgi:hypothetical protein